MTPYFVCFVGYPSQGGKPVRSIEIDPNEPIESIVARIVSGELENVVEVHAIRPGSMFPWENITQQVLHQAMELMLEETMREPKALPGIANRFADESNVVRFPQH